MSILQKSFFKQEASILSYFSLRATLLLACGEKHCSMAQKRAAKETFHFPGGELEHASEQTSAPGVSKKMGRSGEGVSKKKGLRVGK